MIIRALVLALMLAGCAGRETTALVASPGGLPPVAQVAAVPFHPQSDKACGPASLAMVLAWGGLATSPERLSTEVYTPGRDGSLPVDLAGAARRHGMLAMPVRTLGDVLAELAAGHPVVVFQNLGLAVEPLWHFAVAIGYDLAAREIVLHSGLDPNLRMGLDTFEHTWERGGNWALAVLPPGRLPVTATEADAIMAAAGLERVGLAPSAVRAYQSILDRWPDSVGATIGHGNALLARGDLAAAERAFRRATELAPNLAAAWNNLAHVLLERGNRAEARVAARRAVDLAGDHGAYGETLKAAVNEAPSATGRHP